MNENGSVDWCFACMGKMAIRCTWCGGPIFIGDPVTLYISPSGHELPEYAVVYKEEPLQVVGCLGFDCADTRADRAGLWLPGDDGNGYVHRDRQSVYEALLLSKDQQPMAIL